MCFQYNYAHEMKVLFGRLNNNFARLVPLLLSATLKPGFAESEIDFIFFKGSKYVTISFIVFRNTAKEQMWKDMKSNISPELE